MYKSEYSCIVCGSKIQCTVRTDKNESDEFDYSIIEKNNDNTFKCEVIAKCPNCKAKQKIFCNINLI